MYTNQTDQRKEYEREKAYKDMEQHRFNWHIWALSAIGLFANSYSMFSMRFVLPLLAFSNWRNDDGRQNQETVKTAILTGSIIGQLVFGYFADRHGLLKFYGYYFIALTYVTVCLAQSSSGFNSMSILALLMFWGFFAGLINGAAQPLAATITAEFAPRQSRARMMAALFLMQPLGQLGVLAISLLTLITVGKSHDLSEVRDPTKASLVMDKMWRLLIVVNAVFAFTAFIVRCTCSESPRYALKADDDHSSVPETWEIPSTAAVGAGHSELDGPLQRSKLYIDAKIPAVASNKYKISGLDATHELGSSAFSYSSIKQYFWVEGNVRCLLASCTCWFLTGMASSGLGMSNPHKWTQIWTSSPLENSVTSFSGGIDREISNSSIYEALMQDSIHRIITISVGPLLGSVIMLGIIDYVPWKKMLAYSFLGLAALFGVAGGWPFDDTLADFQLVRATIGIICQVLCNFGLNTLLFIISTEIFPACYRTTCHGISAACGAFGFLVVRLCISIDDSNELHLRRLLTISSFLMICGAGVAWAWIPEVQNLQIICKGRKIPSKDLEDLCPGSDNSMKAKEI